MTVEAYCQRSGSWLLKSKRAYWSFRWLVCLKLQTSTLSCCRKSRKAFGMNDFPCGHKFGNDLETGHKHICQTITYTIITMLMLHTFTYSVRFQKYFQDFRVTPSCPTHLLNKKLPFWGRFYQSGYHMTLIKVFGGHSSTTEASLQHSILDTSVFIQQIVSEWPGWPVSWPDTVHIHSPWMTVKQILGNLPFLEILCCVTCPPLWGMQPITFTRNSKWFLLLRKFNCHVRRLINELLYCALMRNLISTYLRLRKWPNSI